MSIAATTWIWEQREVPLATRAVLLAIADMINRTGEAWPSLGLIANKCEISERMVQKHLVVAQKLGLINITRSTGKKSVYNLPTPELYDGANNTTPPNNMTPTPEQYDGGYPINRNESEYIREQREAGEKKEFPEWFKTLLRIRTKRSETAVTEKIYKALFEWAEGKHHTESNMENTALYIETAWEGQLSKHKNIRATFQNLVNRGANNGFTRNGTSQANTDNAATRPVGAPSPLL